MSGTTFSKNRLTLPKFGAMLGPMRKAKLKTQYPGVRYREHLSRKLRNGQSDRYFFIRYRVDGKDYEEGLGWVSEGWNAEKAHGVLSRMKLNHKTGEGPIHLSEARANAAKKRQAEEDANKAEDASTITLAEFFAAYYLPRAKREKRSWATDELRFRKLIAPHLGHLPLKAITKADIQKFVDFVVATPAAPSTVKQYIGIIRSAFNMALETTVSGEPIVTGLNPATGLRLPAVHNNRERYLTGQEADILIKAASALRYPDLHDAIVLSLNTGLRLGELRRLIWLDVDFPAKFLTVRDEAKRKPGGKVPINAEAEKILHSRKGAAKPTDLVFPPIFGKTSRENLSHEFHRLVEALGFNEGLDKSDRQRRVVFHTLRHSFASWLALAGVDIYRIKTLMRHKTLEMTMRYAHLIPDATKDAVHNLSPPQE